MSVARKQPIVSPFSQGSVVPALIMTAVAILFYCTGLQVYIHGEIWSNLAGFEEVRGSFYLGRTSADYVFVRPVEYAAEDLILFIFGLDNPLPFHAIVLGLHIANSILVFLVLKKVMDSVVGFLGALLFISFYGHPEVVTYHFGIGEALRAIFSLSCIILFYRYRGNPTKTNYVLTLGAFILALGSKESTVFILPPLIYLVDRYIQMESRVKGNDKLKKSFYIAWIPFIMTSVAWWLLINYMCSDPKKGNLMNSVWLYVPALHFNWTRGCINFYNSTVASFNFCSLKGPGSGRLFLVLSLLLSFLPFFDRELKRRLILLWAGWLLTIIPLIPIGMNFRYLYITAAFSMAIFATCVYHLILYVAGRFRLKEGYVTFLAILVFSVAITTSFLYVRRHVEYLKDVGRVSESLWSPILADFPQGMANTRLVFINLPKIYEPPLDKGYIGVRHLVTVGPIDHKLAVAYGKHNVGAIYWHEVPELYGGRHPLWGWSRLSPQELEKLTMEKDTRVYIFNPGNDTFLDATGRDYDSLRKLISKN